MRHGYVLMLCRNYVFEAITDEQRLCRVLCFPRPERGCCSQRLEVLRELGIEYLYSFGNLLIERGLRVVGKGHSAIVVLAKHNRIGVVGLKVRRIDSTRDSLESEARMLMLAENTDLVPKIFAFTRDFIVREYIDGSTLKHLIASAAEIPLKKIFVKLIEAAFELDRIGIDIAEVSRPDTQVVFMCNDPEKPYFIDLGSAKLSPWPTNVTRIISSLVRDCIGSQVFCKKWGEGRVRNLILLSRQYKKSLAEEVRRCILMQIINEIYDMN